MLLYIIRQNITRLQSETIVGISNNMIFGDVVDVD